MKSKKFNPPILIVISIVIFSTVNIFAQQSGAGKNLRFLPGGGNTGSIVSIPDSASLDIANAITLEAWVRRADGAVGPNRIFTKAPEVYAMRIGQCCDQRVQFLLNGNAGVISTLGENVTAFGGRWLHLAATWNGSGDRLMRMYINGRETVYNTQNIVNPPLDNGTTELWLSLWHETFNGHIDQARVWNVARSQSQILNWMHKTENLNLEAGLVSVWHMNEGTGLTTADLLGLNNGTLRSCDRSGMPTCTGNSNAPQWQNSTAPFGDKGIFVDSMLPTATGPAGGTITATITSAANLSNNLGLYQFGTLGGGFVPSGTFDILPYNLESRSNIVWGAHERGTVTANLVFNYSSHPNIADPSKVEIIRRTDSNDATWEIVTESSRNDTSRTITLTGLTTFEEYALGIRGADCAPAPMGLISWWQMEETTGTRAIDVRSSLDAVLMGTVSRGTAGKVSTAYNFDTVDDFLSVPDNALLDFGANQDFTIDAWIRTSASGSPTLTIVDKRVVSGSVNGYVVFLANGNLAIQLSDGTPNNYGSASGDLRDGQWHHIAVSVDRANPSGGLRFFVDGAQVGSGLVAINGDLSNTAAFLIGTHAVDSMNYFNGRIDELEVFNRALSGAEVAAIFNAGATGKCRPAPLSVPGSLAGWWPGDGDALDFLNLNNGTLQNGTAFTIGKVGQTFVFDGVDDRVSTNLDVQPSVMPNFTFEAWIYPTMAANGEQAIYSTEDPDIDFERALVIQGSPTSFFRIHIGGESWVVPVPSVTFNQWQHVAVAYFPGAVNFYVNGQFAAARTGISDAAPSSNRFMLGSSPVNVNESFQGRIDEASVYSRALISAEILAIYNAGMAGKLKQLTTPSGFAIAEERAETDTPESPQAVTVTVGDATLTFPTVTTAGTTHEVPLDPAFLKALPSGQTHTGLAYDIATTAVYSGNVDVCFNLPSFAGLSMTEFNERRVLHLENGNWVNRTTTRDFTLKRICSTVPSLSPFAIVDSNLPPTAASVSISGRVMTSDGRGISRARVSLTDASGFTRTVLTNPFGYYNFAEVETAQTVTMEVSHKRYQFVTHVITVMSEIENLDFIAQ